MATQLEKDLANIGKRVKELRASKGYTSYRQFADTFEIEPKSVWRIEEGRSDFKYSSLKRILEALDTKVEDFFRSL
jgi:transcriptional regulator with XRE-family HTH domain